MKRLLVIVLALFMALSVFAGCGRGANTKVDELRYDPETVDTQMEGELEIWWGPMDYMKEPLERAIASFNEKFPNVTVKPMYQLHSDYYEQLNLAYMNNTAPDIIRMDHVLLQSLGESKRVVNLNTLTEGKVTEMEKDKFLPAAWDGVSITESLYGFPFDTNTTLLMYNEVICKEVFGENYTPPTTYEELVSQSKQVYEYEANGIHPYKGLVMAIAASGSEHDIYVLNGWLSRYGATILNDDRSAATLDTPEAIEAMQKLVDMVQSGACEYVGYAPTLENEFLYNGTTAFIEMGSWVYDTIQLLDNNKDGESDIKIAPMPVLKEGIPGYATLGLFGLGITNQCEAKNIPAAYEFIKFLATDYDAQLDYAKSTNTMPTLIEGQNDPYYSEGENTEFWQAFKTQLQLSLPRPGTMLWPEITEQLKSMERMLMAGRYSVEEILQNTTKTINELIEEMKG